MLDCLRLAVAPKGHVLRGAYNRCPFGATAKRGIANGVCAVCDILYRMLILKTEVSSERCGSRISTGMRHWILSVTFAAIALTGFCHFARAGVNLDSLRPLPVQDNGRSKPIDTFALETVRFVTGNSKFGPVTDGDDGQKISQPQEALAVLLDWNFHKSNWERRPVLYVPLLDLRAKLGMPAANKWISPRQLRTNLAIKQWTADLLARHTQAEKDGEEAEFTRIEDADMELYRRLQAFDAASSASSIDVFPDAKASDHWFSIFELSSPTPVTDNADALTIPAAWESMGEAYLADDDVRFESATANLLSAIRKANGFDAGEESRMAREVFYNRIVPFRIVWIVYGFAVMGLVASNMSARPMVYGLAMGVFCTAILLHVCSFVLRCSITGWAPVTNMYETVIWVSMISAIVALVLELISRRRTAALAGSVVAMLVAIVADTMPPEYGSSIRNLTPVLRSNYWLIIHVLTIVSSYAAFALAMVLGDIVLFQFARAKRGDLAVQAVRSETIRTNLAFVYRSVQVGVLLVAAGTILGGLWADVSWGRFWGWDPKEVWALIVLLTYLALLHGRFAGWIGQFGLAAGAVICFTTVLMSWYGVNFVLGTGLHAYGFGTGGQGYVFSFVVAQWAYVAIIWNLHRRSVMKSKPKLESSIPSIGLMQHAD